MTWKKSIFISQNFNFSRREVQTAEGEKFARANEMLFIETSAKTGMNIEKTFIQLGEEIYSKVKEGIIDLSNDVRFFKISLTN